MDVRSATGLTVGQVMHPGVLSCPADTPAVEVARMMAERSVHCVAVIGPARDGSGTPRVWGIVSDLDVVSALTRPGSPPAAADLATAPVITVRPSARLDEAAGAMVHHGVHHVVVTDPERHTPVGVLSTLDVAATLAGEHWSPEPDAPHPSHRRPPAGPRRADRAAAIRRMLRDAASRNP